MFLVCGEALFDFFYQAAEDEQPSRIAYQAVAGGSPFNVAVGLRRLGVDSGFLAGLSTDFLGARLRSVLASEGVSNQWLQDFAAPTTLSMVAVGSDGSPQYSFRGEGCADRLLTPDQLPSLDASVRGLHVGSFSLVVEPIGNTLLSLVRRESQRRLISLDPNVRLNAEPDIDKWRRRVADFAAHAHLIKVSEEDLLLLYPEQALEDIAQGWLTQQCQLVFITHGGQGATVYSRRHGSAWVPAQAITVADTVGAGDTFQAALITWLTEHRADTPAGLAELSRDDLETVLKFAAAAAAITCTRIGPDLPYRQQLA